MAAAAVCLSRLRKAAAASGFAPLKESMRRAQVESVLVAVSPDPYTIRFSSPRNLSLINPIASSTTVSRSSREGGFVITVTGQGFPSSELPSSAPRVSFGSTIVPATFAQDAHGSALVCTVPAHAPAKVPLSLSFDGETFVRGVSGARCILILTLSKRHGLGPCASAVACPSVCLDESDIRPTRQAT